MKIGSRLKPPDPGRPDQIADEGRAVGAVEGVIDAVDPLHVRAEPRLPGEIERHVDTEPARFRHEWVSAAEGEKFSKLVTEVTEQVRALGPLNWPGLMREKGVVLSPGAMRRVPRTPGGLPLARLLALEEARLAAATMAKANLLEKLKGAASGFVVEMGDEKEPFTYSQAVRRLKAFLPEAKTRND